VVFLAVPPPKLGDFIVQYDELYPKGLSSDQLAPLVAGKMGGQFFETFLIDGRAGRMTAMGFGKTFEDQYAEAFARCQIESRTTGSRFIRGTDDKEGRANLVRNWLVTRPDGTTKYRIVERTCGNTIWEFGRFKKRIVSGTAKEESIDRDNHLMDCLGYLAGHHPKWIQPSIRKHPGSTSYRLFQEFLAKNETEDSAIYMGPGAA
jgi:hypothetical protein